jgi:adenine C2-methylase RlmN of 23S rRNA A2503 and tRNA A37
MFPVCFFFQTVIMRYWKRATVCISSQVGCRMACRFCSTGTMGLLGHLTAGEMCEQLLHASDVAPIRNVVFMGMGEPLDNYEELLGAVRAMVDPGRFGLSPAKVTVSTVGMVPRIRALARDVPGVRLALSLHAPTQELRCKIVPTARSWPLHSLMAAVDDYMVAR